MKNKMFREALILLMLVLMYPVTSKAGTLIRSVTETTINGNTVTYIGGSSIGTGMEITSSASGITESSAFGIVNVGDVLNLFNTLIFNTGGYISSTSTIPVYANIGQVLSSTVDASVFANGTTDCGISEAANYCIQQRSSLCNITVPRICFVSSTIALPASLIYSLHGAGNDYSIIIPTADLTTLFNLQNSSNGIYSNLIITNPYNRNIGVVITSSGQYNTFSNIKSYVTPITATVVLYNITGGNGYWGWYDTFDHVNFGQNTNVGNFYAIYVYSVYPSYTDDMNMLSIKNSNIEGNVYMYNAMGLDWENNRTNNSGQPAIYAFYGITGSTIRNLEGSDLSLYLSQSSYVNFDQIYDKITFRLDQNTSNIVFSNCKSFNNMFDTGDSLNSLYNYSASNAILDNCYFSSISGNYISKTDTGIATNNNLFLYGSGQTVSTIGVYDNNTGKYNMGHTVDYGQQQLVNGCATVVLQYPFQTNHYSCSFRYLTSNVVIGIPVFTYTTNVFTVCSKSSLGAINTNDANTFTGTCSGY
jgi:hypothetical protein